MELKELLDKKFTSRQIKIIREWGDLAGTWKQLTGTANYEGGGSRGLAFRFDDKILKVTNDISEAQACAKLIGISHPNIYETYTVAQTTPIDIGYDKKAPYYLIIEEYWPPSDEQQRAAAQYVLYKVDRRRGIIPNKIYYDWEPGFLNKFKSMLAELVQEATANPILLTPENEFTTMSKMLKFVAMKLRWSSQHANLFTQFFACIPSAGKALHGLEDTHLSAAPPWRKEDTVERGLITYAKDLLASKEIEYLHQIALSLTFLEQQGIHFYDLTAGNIRSKNGQIGLIDLGYSQIQNTTSLTTLDLTEAKRLLQNNDTDILKQHIAAVLKARLN